MSDAYLKRIAEQRKLAETRFNEILDRAVAENRDTTAEENANLKTVQEDMKRLKDHMDDILATQKLAAAGDEMRAALQPVLERGVERSSGHQATENEILADLMTGKRSEYIAERSPEFNRRVLTTPGGSAIATTFADFVAVAMITSNPTYELARKLQTRTGQPIVVPQVTAHPAISLTGENTAIATANPTIDHITMLAFKYPVLSDFSFELERDEIIGLDSLLGQSIGIAAGTAIGYDLTLGTGTVQPNGFVNGASAGATASVTTASGTGFFDWLDCIALKNSVPAPYRNARTAAWQVSNTALTKMQQFRDTQNQPIWLASPVPGVVDTFAGKPIYENPAMAAVASASLSVAYGDFYQYIVREVVPLRVERSSEWKFGTDLITLKTVFTMDGHLSVSTAIKTLKSYNT